jgi:hypothetical protein
MVATKKSLNNKFLKTLNSWRNVFSIFYASGLSLYNDAFLTNYKKKYQKSKNPGHLRPGP